MRVERAKLGIDPKTGHHRKLPLTPWESAFLSIIWVDHVGRDSAIPALEFAGRFVFKIRGRVTIPGDLEDWKRIIRDIQNHLLIEHNIPVYSAAGYHGGYWIGENKAEGAAFYETFRKRGLTGMVKASRGKKSAMVDMVTQLSFEWEDLVLKAGMQRPDRGETDAAPVEVVDAFLQKMIKDPEKFAAGLRLLGEKYGSVLVPRKRFNQIVGALKSQTAQLSNLISSLEE